MKRDSLVVAEGCVLSGDEVGRTRPNANALIVGTTGCGKSTSVILPTVARMHCSNPILSYAKERDAYLMAEYLKRKNYMVHILNAAHPKKSTLSYDPIASIESYADIEALSAAIVDMSIRKSVDDYWQVKAKQLLSGLIAGCFMTSKGSRMPGMADVLALFDKTIPCENAYGVEPELYGMFQRLEKASPGCFAVREFNSWRSLPERTASCVRDTLAGALSTVFPESIRRMMREKPQFDPVRFASRKEALLVITSAADTAQQYYANLFYRSSNCSDMRPVVPAASCPGKCATSLMISPARPLFRALPATSACSARQGFRPFCCCSRSNSWKLCTKTKLPSFGRTVQYTHTSPAGSITAPVRSSPNRWICHTTRCSMHRWVRCS